ncbi:MAG TPA: lipocalin-like domain-containing protein [Nocardioidaceae bacterium]|nr:lipocalin-like domain-containing protein [Nocardioidaceae bacterium]
MSDHIVDSIRGALLGAWELVSWESIGADGRVAYPLGDDAIGLLMYTATPTECRHSWCAWISRDLPATTGVRREFRHYTFDPDGRLVLDADTSWGRVRIIWRRVSTGVTSINS